MFIYIYTYNIVHVCTAQVLSLYKEHVDPGFEWSNFTVEEQDKILKGGNSRMRVPYLQHATRWRSRTRYSKASGRGENVEVEGRLGTERGGERDRVLTR